MSEAGSAPTTRSLRTRVRQAITLIAVASVLLFGVPLAVVLGRLIDSQALAALQRDATRGVAAVPDNVIEQNAAVVAPPSRGDTRIGVYDAHGDLVAGRGPAHSKQAAAAADGREHDGHDAGDLSVVAPVLSDTTIAGSVRAAVPLAVLQRRVYQAWGLLFALALLVLAIAVVLARRAAQRIAIPFERLTLAAREVEQGSYDVDLPHFGMSEADAAAEALRDSAREVDRLLRQEREFVRDASHQLRTPLAGAVLLLGSEPPDVAGALDRLAQVETTLADLLSLRRTRGAASCDPGAIAADAVRRWSTADRPVDLRADQTSPVALSAAALRQSLDVLIDNAVRHGGGAITVTVEAVGDQIVVEVADNGPGFTIDAVPGIGLALVTRLVERVGGSLLLRRRSPKARVALLLPRFESPTVSRARSDTQSPAAS